jgi:hypothetical protein
MADEHSPSQDREKNNYYQCSTHRFVTCPYRLSKENEPLYASGSLNPLWNSLD